LLELYFQRAPHELSRSSRYRDVQGAHAFPYKSALIPDLVLKTESQGGRRWLLIEIKGGEKRGVANSARDATLDLLAYRRAFDHALSGQVGVYGLGYAWGTELYPSVDAEIMLCSPDQLDDALQLALG